MGVLDILRRTRRIFSGGKENMRQNSSITNPEWVHAEARIVDSILRGKIQIGKGAIIKDCFLQARELHIGRNSSLWGPNIDVHAMLNPVRIGSFCSIARNVTIQEYNHRMDRCSTYFFSSNVFNEGMEQDIASRGPVTIGNDVWIASHVVIGSGVTIGDGAVIGANSVVLDDVPPYAVVAGSPARVLRFRFDEPVIERLRALKWWEWDDERLLRNRALFLEALSMDVLDGVE